MPCASQYLGLDSNGPGTKPQKPKNRNCDRCLFRVVFNNDRRGFIEDHDFESAMWYFVVGFARAPEPPTDFRRWIIFCVFHYTPQHCCLANVEDGPRNLLGKEVFLKFFDPMYINPDDWPTIGMPPVNVFLPICNSTSLPQSRQSILSMMRHSTVALNLWEKIRKVYPTRKRTQVRHLNNVDIQSTIYRSNEDLEDSIGGKFMVKYHHRNGKLNSFRISELRKMLSFSVDRTFLAGYSIANFEPICH